MEREGGERQGSGNQCGGEEKQVLEWREVEKHGEGGCGGKAKAAGGKWRKRGETVGSFGGKHLEGREQVARKAKNNHSKTTRVAWETRRDKSCWTAQEHNTQTMLRQEKKVSLLGSDEEEEATR